LVKNGSGFDYFFRERPSFAVTVQRRELRSDADGGSIGKEYPLYTLLHSLGLSSVITDGTTRGINDGSGGAAAGDAIIMSSSSSTLRDALWEKTPLLWCSAVAVSTTLDRNDGGMPPSVVELSMPPQFRIDGGGRRGAPSPDGSNNATDAPTHAGIVAVINITVTHHRVGGGQEGRGEGGVAAYTYSIARRTAEAAVGGGGTDDGQNSSSSLSSCDAADWRLLYRQDDMSSSSAHDGSSSALWVHRRLPLARVGTASSGSSPFLSNSPPFFTVVDVGSGSGVPSQAVIGRLVSRSAADVFGPLQAPSSSSAESFPFYRYYHVGEGFDGLSSASPSSGSVDTFTTLSGTLPSIVAHQYWRCDDVIVNVQHVLRRGSNVSSSRMINGSSSGAGDAEGNAPAAMIAMSRRRFTVVKTPLSVDGGGSCGFEGMRATFKRTIPPHHDDPSSSMAAEQGHEEEEEEALLDGEDVGLELVNWLLTAQRLRRYRHSGGGGSDDDDYEGSNGSFPGSALVGRVVTAVLRDAAVESLLHSTLSNPALSLNGSASSSLVSPFDLEGYIYRRFFVPRSSSASPSPSASPPISFTMTHCVDLSLVVTGGSTFRGGDAHVGRLPLDRSQGNVVCTSSGNDAENGNVSSSSSTDDEGGCQRNYTTEQHPLFMDVECPSVVAGVGATDERIAFVDYAAASALGVNAPAPLPPSVIFRGMFDPFGLRLLNITTMRSLGTNSSSTFNASSSSTSYGPSFLSSAVVFSDASQLWVSSLLLCELTPAAKTTVDAAQSLLALARYYFLPTASASSPCRVQCDVPLALVSYIERRGGAVRAHIRLVKAYSSSSTSMSAHVGDVAMNVSALLGLGLGGVGESIYSSFVSSREVSDWIGQHVERTNMTISILAIPADGEKALLGSLSSVPSAARFIAMQLADLVRTVEAESLLTTVGSSTVTRNANDTFLSACSPSMIEGYLLSPSAHNHHRGHRGGDTASTFLSSLSPPSWEVVRSSAPLSTFSSSSSSLDDSSTFPSALLIRRGDAAYPLLTEVCWVTTGEGEERRSGRRGSSSPLSCFEGPFEGHAAAAAGAVDAIAVTAVRGDAISPIITFDADGAGGSSSFSLLRIGRPRCRDDYGSVVACPAPSSIFSQSFLSAQAAARRLVFGRCNRSSAATSFSSSSCDDNATTAGDSEKDNRGGVGDGVLLSSMWHSNTSINMYAAPTTRGSNDDENGNHTTTSVVAAVPYDCSFIGDIFNASFVAMDGLSVDTSGSDDASGVNATTALGMSNCTALERLLVTRYGVLSANITSAASAAGGGNGVRQVVITPEKRAQCLLLSNTTNATGTRTNTKGSQTMKRPLLLSPFTSRTGLVCHRVVKGLIPTRMALLNEKRSGGSGGTSTLVDSALPSSEFPSFAPLATVVDDVLPFVSAAGDDDASPPIVGFFDRAGNAIDFVASSLSSLTVSMGLVACSKNATFVAMFPLMGGGGNASSDLPPIRFTIDAFDNDTNTSIAGDGSLNASSSSAFVAVDVLDLSSLGYAVRTNHTTTTSSDGRGGLSVLTRSMAYRNRLIAAASSLRSSSSSSKSALVPSYNLYALLSGGDDSVAGATVAGGVGLLPIPSLVHYASSSSSSAPSAALRAAIPNAALRREVLRGLTLGGDDEAGTAFTVKIDVGVTIGGRGPLFGIYDFLTQGSSGVGAGDTETATQTQYERSDSFTETVLSFTPDALVLAPPPSVPLGSSSSSTDASTVYLANITVVRIVRTITIIRSINTTTITPSSYGDGGGAAVECNHSLIAWSKSAAQSHCRVRPAMVSQLNATATAAVTIVRRQHVRVIVVEYVERRVTLLNSTVSNGTLPAAISGSVEVLSRKMPTVAFDNITVTKTTPTAGGGGPSTPQTTTPQAYAYALSAYDGGSDSPPDEGEGEKESDIPVTALSYYTSSSSNSFPYAINITVDYCQSLLGTTAATQIVAERLSSSSRGYINQCGAVGWAGCAAADLAVSAVVGLTSLHSPPRPMLLYYSMFTVNNSEYYVDDADRCRPVAPRSTVRGEENGDDASIIAADGTVFGDEFTTFINTIPQVPRPRSRSTATVYNTPSAAPVTLVGYPFSSAHKNGGDPRGAADYYCYLTNGTNIGTIREWWGQRSGGLGGVELTQFAVKARAVSRCQLRCDVPPQQYPLRPSANAAASANFNGKGLVVPTVLTFSSSSSSSSFSFDSAGSVGDRLFDVDRFTGWAPPTTSSLVKGGDDTTPPIYGNASRLGFSALDGVGMLRVVAVPSALSVDTDSNVSVLLSQNALPLTVVGPAARVVATWIPNEALGDDADDDDDSSGDDSSDDATTMSDLLSMLFPTPEILNKYFPSPLQQASTATTITATTARRTLTVHALSSTRRVRLPSISATLVDALGTPLGGWGAGDSGGGGGLDPYRTTITARITLRSASQLINGTIPFAVRGSTCRPRALTLVNGTVISTSGHGGGSSSSRSPSYYNSFYSDCPSPSLDLATNGLAMVCGAAIIAPNEGTYAVSVGVDTADLPPPLRIKITTATTTTGDGRNTTSGHVQNSSTSTLLVISAIVSDAVLLTVSDETLVINHTSLLLPPYPLPYISSVSSSSGAVDDSARGKFPIAPTIGLFNKGSIGGDGGSDGGNFTNGTAIDDGTSSSSGTSPRLPPMPPPQSLFFPPPSFTGTRSLQRSWPWHFVDEYVSTVTMIATISRLDYDPPSSARSGNTSSSSGANASDVADETDSVYDGDDPLAHFWPYITNTPSSHWRVNRTVIPSQEEGTELGGAGGALGGVDTCSSVWGNCELASNGVATFSKLRFIGIPGRRYRVTIRQMYASSASSESNGGDGSSSPLSDNSSSSVEAIEPTVFDVTVPRCGMTSFAYANTRGAIPSAAVYTPSSFTLGVFEEKNQTLGHFPINSQPFDPLSLLSSSSSSSSVPYGVVVKGWAFSPPPVFTRSPFLYPSPYQVRQVLPSPTLLAPFDADPVMTTNISSGSGSSSSSSSSSSLANLGVFYNVTNSTFVSEGYGCLYQGGSSSASAASPTVVASYPAQFIDMCTVLCFLDDHTTTSSDTSVATCGGNDDDLSTGTTTVLSTTTAATSDSSSPADAITDAPSGGADGNSPAAPGASCCYTRKGSLSCTAATTAPLSVVYTVAPTAVGSANTVITAAAGDFTIIGAPSGIAVVDAWDIFFENEDSATSVTSGSITSSTSSASSSSVNKKLLSFTPNLPFGPSNALPIFDNIDQIVTSRSRKGAPLTVLQPFAVSLVDSNNAPIGAADYMSSTTVSSTAAPTSSSPAVNSSSSTASANITSTTVPTLKLWISKITRVAEESLMVPQPRERLMTSSQAERRATAPSSCFPRQRNVTLLKVPHYYDFIVSGQWREWLQNRTVNPTTTTTMTTTASPTTNSPTTTTRAPRTTTTTTAVVNPTTSPTMALTTNATTTTPHVTTTSALTMSSGTSSNGTSDATNSTSATTVEPTFTNDTFATPGAAEGNTTNSTGTSLPPAMPSSLNSSSGSFLMRLMRAVATDVGMGNETNSMETLSAGNATETDVNVTVPETNASSSSSSSQSTTATTGTMLTPPPTITSTSSFTPPVSSLSSSPTATSAPSPLPSTTTAPPPPSGGDNSTADMALFEAMLREYTDFIAAVGDVSDYDDIYGSGGAGNGEGRFSVPHRYEANGSVLIFTDPYHPNSFTAPIVDGVGQFTNLSLVFPAGGLYTIEVKVVCVDESSPLTTAGSPLPTSTSSSSSDGDTCAALLASAQFLQNMSFWSAGMRVHVLPGPPSSLCVWSSFAESTTRSDGTLTPNPRLLLLDAANNVYQPTRREPRLSANSFYSALNYEAFAQSVTVSTELQRRVYDSRFGFDGGIGSITEDVEDGLPPVPPHIIALNASVRRNDYYAWERMGVSWAEGDGGVEGMDGVLWSLLMGTANTAPPATDLQIAGRYFAAQQETTPTAGATVPLASTATTTAVVPQTTTAVPVTTTPAPTPTPSSIFSLTAPSCEYSEDNGVGVMQLQLRSITVQTVYGYQYRFGFRSKALEEENARLWALLPPANISSPSDLLISSSVLSSSSSTAVVAFTTPTDRFLLYLCAPSEFAVRGTDVCLTCPSGSDHCHGGLSGDCFQCNGSTVMTLKGNYWRYAWYSTHAYTCPASSCGDGGAGDGGTPSTNDASPSTEETITSDTYSSGAELARCAPGYRQGSPLCNECIDGHAKDFLDQCLSCPPMWVSGLLLLGIVVAVVVVLFLFIMLSLKDMDAGDEVDDELMMTIKIFVNFVQTTSMLGSFKVNFPAFVLSYFDFVAASSGSAGISINPINCLFPWLTFLEKMDAQLLLPIVMLLAFGLLLIIQNHRRNRRRERQLRPTLTDDLTPNPKTGRVLDNQKLLDARRRITLERPLLQVFGNASMIVLFLTYQSIAGQCIKVYDCITLVRSDAPDDIVRLLQLDTRVECSGPMYELHMGISMYGLLGYGFIIPSIGILFVQHVAATQGWSAARRQFGFLIKGFRLRLWWWEMVIVMRKIILLLLLAVVEDSVLQALLGIWFLTFSFVVQTFARPFVKSMHNYGEQLSLLTALVTLNIGLAFRTQETDTGERCGSVCQGFSVVLIFFNVVTMLIFLVFILTDGYDQLVEQFGIDSAYGTRWFSLRNVKNRVLSLLKEEHERTPNFSTYTPKFVDEGLTVAIFGYLPNTNPRRRGGMFTDLLGERGDGGTQSQYQHQLNQNQKHGGGKGDPNAALIDADAANDEDEELFKHDPDVIVRGPDGYIDTAATFKRRLWKTRVLDGMVVDEEGNVVRKNKHRYLGGGGPSSPTSGGVGGTDASLLNRTSVTTNANFSFLVGGGGQNNNNSMHAVNRNNNSNNSNSNGGGPNRGNNNSVQKSVNTFFDNFMRQMKATGAGATAATAAGVRKGRASVMDTFRRRRRGESSTAAGSHNRRGDLNSIIESSARNGGIGENGIEEPLLLPLMSDDDGHHYYHHSGDANEEAEEEMGPYSPAAHDGARTRKGSRRRSTRRNNTDTLASTASSPTAAAPSSPSLSMMPSSGGFSLAAAYPSLALSPSEHWIRQEGDHQQQRHHHRRNVVPPLAPRSFSPPSSSPTPRNNRQPHQQHDSVTHTNITNGGCEEEEDGEELAAYHDDVYADNPNGF